MGLHFEPPGHPRSSFESIGPSGVSASQALHEKAEIGGIVSRVHYQVHLIRHETVCVDLHAEFLSKLAKRR
jgi:hypothetical protein